MASGAGLVGWKDLLPEGGSNEMLASKCLFVVVGILTAEAALLPRFQEPSGGGGRAVETSALANSGDASKVGARLRQRTIAVILPAGGQQVTGPQGAETLFEKLLSKAASREPQDNRARRRGRKATLPTPMGRWGRPTRSQELGGHWTNVPVNRRRPVAHCRFIPGALEQISRRSLASEHQLNSCQRCSAR